jgi:hypothetical protein
MVKVVKNNKPPEDSPEEEPDEENSHPPDSERISE